jgi:hypothetical protein
LEIREAGFSPDGNLLAMAAYPDTLLLLDGTKAP